jgi:outer membrane protein OmpA-like peptidoglycan-associated protein
MAELDVQPKKPTPVWLWLLIVIAVVALLFFLLKGCGGDKAASTVTTEDTSGKEPIAVTAPDTSKIDFNSPATKDADVKDPDVVMSGNDKYTIYSLGENILFQEGKTELLGGADAKLQQVSKSLNQRFANGKIRVYGSTDNTGDAAANKTLGKERAEAVKNWLVKNGNVNTDRITVHSFGETEPVASNATAAGKAKNRNVSIVAFPGE